MSGRRPTLSVVVPVHNEEAALETLHGRLVETLDPLEVDWELLCVDDGSTDGSAGVLRRLSDGDTRVKVLSLSRNFGHQLAITAGLDFADGDAVVVMDGDLQDPPEVIPDLLAEWRNGFDVVHAVRARREGESWFKRWSARVFYRLLKRATPDLEIVLDAGDFRLMNRRAVLQLRRLREHHRFLRGLSGWVGFRQTVVPYTRAPRHTGTTKYSLRRMMRLGLSAITSFSFVPLQLASVLGMVLAVLSGAVILAVVVLRFVVGASFLVGQTTTLLAVLFLGGIQLLAIGVIGEYVGRIYDEVKGRPLYVVSSAQGFDWDARDEPGGATDLTGGKD